VLALTSSEDNNAQMAAVNRMSCRTSSTCVLPGSSAAQQVMQYYGVWCCNFAQSRRAVVHNFCRCSRR
jgi:hypothetical protein